MVDWCTLSLFGMTWAFAISLAFWCLADAKQVFINMTMLFSYIRNHAPGWRPPLHTGARWYIANLAYVCAPPVYVIWCTASLSRGICWQRWFWTNLFVEQCTAYFTCEFGELIRHSEDCFRSVLLTYSFFSRGLHDEWMAPASACYFYIFFVCLCFR